MKCTMHYLVAMKTKLCVIAFLLCYCERVGSGVLSTEGDFSGEDGEEFNMTELLDCCDTFKMKHCANLSLSCSCESLVVLNDSQYEYVDESTVVFNAFTLEVQLKTLQGLPVVCANLSQSGDDNLLGYRILLQMCNCVSIIGCALICVTFFLFKELRTLPAAIVVHIAALLLLSGILYILTEVNAFMHSACGIVGIVLHFLHLAQFSWMTIMCFEECQSFYHASRLIPVRPESKRCQFITYSTAAWGIPLLIVAVSVVVAHTTPFVQYGIDEVENITFCWITHLLAELVAFFIPVIIFTVLQLIFLAVGGFYLAKSRPTCSGENGATYLRVIFAMLTASSLLWLIWITWYATRATWLWYISIILINCQGFILFVSFYCTKKVFKLYTSKISHYSISSA